MAHLSSDTLIELANSRLDADVTVALNQHIGLCHECSVAFARENHVRTALVHAAEPVVSGDFELRLMSLAPARLGGPSVAAPASFTTLYQTRRRKHHVVATAAVVAGLSVAVYGGLTFINFAGDDAPQQPPVAQISPLPDKLGVTGTASVSSVATTTTPVQ